MMSNPAATIAEMPAEMREQLLKVLSETLTTGDVSAAASGLLKRSPEARAQRKRLWMLFKASVPKVLNSPPRSIFQLITFTLTVFATVTAALVRKGIAKFIRMWRRVFRAGRKQKNIKNITNDRSYDEPQTEGT